MFRYDGRAWRKVEDNLRHTMNNLGASDTGTGDRFEGKDVRLTQRGGFVNNTAKSGINSLTVDVFVASSAISTIQTSIPYATGMASGVYLGEISIDSTVSSGAGGNALITLNRTAPVGTRIQYQLYEAAVEQRQSLSKALRPKADQ